MASDGHVVCIPFPALGHVRPMLNLARVLHSNFNFHVTFITINHIHQSLFPHSNGPDLSTSDSNDGAPSIIFESIPDIVEDPKDMISIIKAVLGKQMEPPLKELVSKLRTRTRNGGVTFMVTDVAMTSFTVDVAEEAGISVVVLETAGACSMLAYLQLQELINKGIIPLKDTSYLTNGYLDKMIDWIPSLMGISLKDMPTFLRTADPNDMLLNIVISNAYRALKSKAILINTFDALDQHIVKDLSNFSSNIYPIGPLHLLAAQINSNGTNTEQPEYMQWLDSQEPNSVLYVSFGTIVVTSQDQFAEFAWGLANSDQKFLWVVRSDLILDQPNSLPLGFAKAIEGKGLLVSWCDQEKVLAHPSIGGFLTHCGWNSIIESISNGVPVICRPYAADQVTNCWYCCNCLGIGLKMSEHVKRDEVETVVREIMEGKRGKDMKKKAMEWRKLAKEATMSPHGSSYYNLGNVVHNLLHSLKQ